VAGINGGIGAVTFRLAGLYGAIGSNVLEYYCHSSILLYILQNGVKVSA